MLWCIVHIWLFSKSLLIAIKHHNQAIFGHVLQYVLLVWNVPRWNIKLNVHVSIWIILIYIHEVKVTVHINMVSYKTYISTCYGKREAYSTCTYHKVITQTYYWRYIYIFDNLVYNVVHCIGTNMVSPPQKCTYWRPKEITPLIFNMFSEE